jgi:hypothetical protein
MPFVLEKYFRLHLDHLEYEINNNNNNNNNNNKNNKSICNFNRGSWHTNLLRKWYMKDLVRNGSAWKSGQYDFCCNFFLRFMPVVLNKKVNSANYSVLKWAYLNTLIDDCFYFFRTLDTETRPFCAKSFTRCYGACIMLRSYCSKCINHV